MRIRRLVLDVDKAFAQPSLFDIAAAIEKVSGVEGFNISLEEIDQGLQTLRNSWLMGIGDVLAVLGYKVGFS